MKKRALLGAGTVLVLLVGVFATSAIAGNAPRSSHGTATSCSFGSCFAPDFNAVGDTDSWSGPAAGTIEFADCCIAGDKYKVTAKGPVGGNASMTFTSKGTLDDTCTTSTPYPDQGSISLPSGATSVSMTLVKTKGGVPATAYMAMSSSGWAYTAGSDTCGY